MIVTHRDSEPTLYVIGGCNGAGKTTFACEFLPSVGVRRFLNADEIARGLSQLDPQALQLRAGRLMLSELRALIARGENQNDKAKEKAADEANGQR